MSLIGSVMENWRKWGLGPGVDGLPKKGQHFLAKQALREVPHKMGMLARIWLRSQEQCAQAPPPNFSMTPGEHFIGPPIPSAPSSGYKEGPKEERCHGRDITTRVRLTISRDWGPDSGPERPIPAHWKPKTTSEESELALVPYRITDMIKC